MRKLFILLFLLSGVFINSSATANENNNGDIHRVAILLPLGDENAQVRQLAQDIFNAAQLALFDTKRGNLFLTLHDTKGTPAGGRAAAEEAIAADAELIIGPLFAATAQAILPSIAAAQIPTLAFSNDRRLLDGNQPRAFWLLGFLPDQSIAAAVEAATAQGLARFAALIPAGEDGDAVLQNLRDALAEHGGTLIAHATYPANGNAEALHEPVRTLARFDTRTAAYKEHRARIISEAKRIVKEKNLTLLDRDDATLFATIAEHAPHLAAPIAAIERSETQGALGFDAVFIPEGGLALRNLAPLLPYYDLNPRRVKFIGTGLWNAASIRREPALHGGWYAAPPQKIRAAFVKHYNKTYSYAPPRIAGLAYDAVALAARLLAIYGAQAFAYETLTHPDGFSGVEGKWRFAADGTTHRLLAIYEIQARGGKMVFNARENFVGY